MLVCRRAADLQAAQDAKVQLGSGPNAITAIRSSNSVQDLIPGVTLNLASEAPSTPVTISVTQDTAKIKDSVQKLVDQYNNAVDFLNAQFQYDPDKQTSGTLLNSFALQGVQGDLQQVFTGSAASTLTARNSETVWKTFIARRRAALPTLPSRPSRRAP